MIIKEVLSQLENAASPVAKVLHKGEQFKVITIGFKKGMILKEHKSNLPARLVVVAGSIIYKEDERSVVMNRFEDLEIPVNKIHSVEALQDSVCFLFQG
jgi:quercetin dioxygenase-like cupin family protein